AFRSRSSSGRPKTSEPPGDVHVDDTDAAERVAAPPSRKPDDDAGNRVRAVVVLPGPMVDAIAPCRSPTTLEPAELAEQLRIVRQLDVARVHDREKLQVQRRSVERSELDRSALYLEFLPVVNAG